MERMDDFFTARVSEYEEHMLSNVPGCREAYCKMAELVPKSCAQLLDLGCGTGLELDEIFKRFPLLQVTGIDLTPAMLKQLREKHGSRKLRLICGDYFSVEFGTDQYDCAISFQTMHHFSHEAKIGLYRKLYAALKEHGIYIECDYMVEEQALEAYYYKENARLRRELGLPENVFYHYDTPCTVRNQIRMLETAGFRKAEQIFRIENTTILVAYK